MVPETSSSADTSAESRDTSEPRESGDASTPVASESPASAATPVSPPAPAGEAGAEADKAAAGEPKPEGDAAAASGEAGAGTAEGEKRKRKRKRRRKKKTPGGPDGVEGASAEGGGEGGEEGEEGDESESGESSPPEGQNQNQNQNRQPRPPKKQHRNKHRPPTDRAPFHVGEEVFGKVTSVLDRALMIDLAGKALAIFDRSEMEADDLVPAAGDRFVARVHQDGVRGGLVVLTRKPLREEDAKPKVEQAAKEGTLIEGLITGVIKGGVEVDILGLRAFAPASGMDLHPHSANFIELLGQVLDFKVIQFDSGGRDVVVTRRPMLEAEAHQRRKKALEHLSEGQVLTGVVRTVVEWGAFVALRAAENLEGLVHVSEASHDSRARLVDLFKQGDEIEVKITKIDEKGKIWLSRKALIVDPWAAAREAYKPGTRHTAKITRVERFGVFVELGDGVEGLIHVADLTLKKIEHPKEIVNVGDTIDVVVHEFDLRDRRISLHPAPPPEQAEEAPQKITRNAVVNVEVIRGEAAGVVVRLLGVTGRGARGYIPGPQTGTARGTDLRKKFPPGQKLTVKVLELDPRHGEPKLSITQAAVDEERRAHKEYRQQLAKEGGFGTLGDLFARKLK